MTRPTKPQIEQLLNKVNKLFREGNTDRLMAYQGELLESATRCSKDIPEDMRLELKARSAQFHLMMMRVYDAASSLQPYAEITGNKEVAVNRSRIAELTSGRVTYSRGLVLRELSNLLYRAHRHNDGVELAAIGNRYLKKEGVGAPTDLDRQLAEHESSIWWSRLLWHSRRFDEAENKIKECIKELSSAMNAESRKAALTKSRPAFGGLDMLLAVALDLWASFDFARGRAVQARRKIYESLFFLRGGRVKCKTRLAFSMYSAARIEASGYSKMSYAWCRYLFQESAKLFGDINHSFQLRAMVLDAQFLTKQESDLSQAVDLLDEVEAKKSAWNLDHDEAGYVKASELLTRVWIEERRARDEPERWESCVERGRQLARVDRMPNRLRAESKLHLGLALVHLESTDAVEEGETLLLEALDLARECKLKKIESAAHFALVEHCLRARRPSEAIEHWTSGNDLLGPMRSSFLYEWSRRLREYLDLDTMEVSLEGGWKAATEGFGRDYLAYQAARYPNRKELFDVIKVPESTGYKLLKKYGIESNNKKVTLVPIEPRKAGRGSDSRPSSSRTP